MRKPDLVIGYEDNGTPVSAACSLCGEWMREDPKPHDSKKTLAGFIEEFNAHLQLRHALPGPH